MKRKTYPVKRSLSRFISLHFGLRDPQSLTRNLQSVVMFAGLLMGIISGLFSCTTEKPAELVVIERQGLPLIYFRVMISAGSAMDPEGKFGLANFTARLLDKGTESYPREEIENTLDQIGAQINISVDKEVVVISGKTLAEHLEIFYPIFKEILTAPSFPEDQVMKMKADQIDQINELRENDSRLSLVVFENELFEGHRYGHAIEGTESSVGSFNRVDAQHFYKENYVRGNILAGIAGAVDEEIVNQFKSDLDQLPTGSVVRMKFAPPSRSEKSVILVEKENRAQSNLRVGHRVNSSRSSEDYYPMLLTGAYLGAHREMFGRLYQTVRSERGLAYGAYAYAEHFQPAGWSKLPANGICRRSQYFHMWTYPKAVNFEFCIKLMLTEMNKLAQGEVTKSDVDQVRSYTANQYAFLMETPDRQLGMRLDALWYDRPNFVADYRKKVENVSESDFKNAARKYLDPNKVLIVAIVSDGEQAKQELLSKETQLELPSGATEGELQSINDAIKAYNLNLSDKDIAIVKAEELFK